MQISVQFYSMLRDKIGKRQAYTIRPGSSVRELLDAIITENGEVARDFLYESNGRFKGSLTVLVKGVNIKRSKGLETILNDGDDVYILPPVSGG